MTLNEAMQAVNGIANIENIHGLTEEWYIQYADGEMEYGKLYESLEILGVSIENLICIDRQIENLYYVDFEKCFYESLFSLGQLIKKILELDKKKKSFSEWIEELQENRGNLIEENGYIAFYFWYMPKPLLLYDFYKRYKDIPENEIIEVFTEIYSMVDYGFSAWKKEVLDYVLAKVDRDSSEEYVTVYRGEGEKSTEVSKAYSWTTNFYVALFFAVRYGGGTAVYRAKVKKCDILMHIDSRNEDEVMVYYENLEEIEKLDMIPAGMEATKEYYSNLAYDYMKFGNDYLKIQKYYDNDGYHGENHILQVLLYTLALAKELELKPREKQILAFCSIVHDMGRCDDDVDDKHGAKSIEIINEFLESNKFDYIHLVNEKLEIAKEIVKYHCIDDEEGIKNIESNELIQDKEQAIKLYKIFKDADALDRVRFDGFKTEFSVDYLRFEESKRLLLMVGSFDRFEIADALLKSLK